MTDKITDQKRNILNAVKLGVHTFRGPSLALANKLWRDGYLNRKSGAEAYEFTFTDRGRILMRVGLTDEQKKAFEDEIAMMLHASRDCLRTKGRHDAARIRFDVSDGYYGEAFGILRALKVLGYAEFGAVNHDDTLSAWLRAIENRVLAEENFGGSNECDHCLARYGKDGAGRRRGAA